MSHNYQFFIDYLDDNAVDELTVKVMKQARISTRRRNEKWDLNVDVTCLEVIFQDELDYDDFMNAFNEDDAWFVNFNNKMLGS